MMLVSMAMMMMVDGHPGNRWRLPVHTFLLSGNRITFKLLLFVATVMMTISLIMIMMMTK